MSPTQRFLAVIFVSGCLAVVTGVNGYDRLSCPKSAIVELDGKYYWDPVRSEFARYYSEDPVWRENGKKFGCLCARKLCLLICCTVAEAIVKDDCIGDKSTLVDRLRVESPRDVHLSIDEPCLTNDSLFEEYEEALLAEFRNRIKVEQTSAKNCRYWRSDPLIELVDVCAHGNSYSLLLWSLACINISGLFALATFIVYSVIPELKNLHGWIFRSYLASYLCSMVHFTIFMLVDRRSNFITFVVIGLIYFGIASLMWVNVMSIDIWRTFRQPTRSIGNSNVNRDRKKRFILYSIYAWSAPGVLMISIALYYYLASKILDHITALVLVIAFAICNTYLYITTALRIRQSQKEVAHQIDTGVNKHHQENEQRFNLYLKLFLVMGGPLVFWSAAIYLRNVIFWWFIYAMEAIQGVSIFYMFVWKDNIKRSICKHFKGVMRTLGSFFLRNSAAPALEIEGNRCCSS